VLGLYKCFYNVRVQWIDGSVQETDTCSLKDFDALIADHQKKLSTHLAALKKLETL
jgi:hypothetical protein